MIFSLKAIKGPSFLLDSYSMDLVPLRAGGARRPMISLAISMTFRQFGTPELCPVFLFEILRPQCLS